MLIPGNFVELNFVAQTGVNALKDRAAIFSHTSSSVGSGDKGPTLRSRLKYLIHCWMDCHEIPERMNRNDLADPLNVHLAPPTGQNVHLIS